MVAQIIDAYIELLMPMGAWVIFWYFLSILIKRNDFVDIAWGLGFIYITLWLTIKSEPRFLQFVVNGMVAAWGLRLAIYLFYRNLKKNEDYRYKQWREDWGEWFLLRSFLQIYILQTFLMLIIALPLILVTIIEPLKFSLISLLGILCWGIGFYWQTLADYQKSKFKNNIDNVGKNKHRDCGPNRGTPVFWRDADVVGYISFLIPYSYGWIGIISPIVTYLLVRVSGVPMLEAKQSQHPEFKAYKETVPAVFPKWINNSIFNVLLSLAYQSSKKI